MVVDSELELNAQYQQFNERIQRLVGSGIKLEVEPTAAPMLGKDDAPLQPGERFYKVSATCNGSLVRFLSLLPGSSSGDKYLYLPLPHTSKAKAKPYAKIALMGARLKILSKAGELFELDPFSGDPWLEEPFPAGSKRTA